MVFEDGFFHADPHPGNFFVEPDGRLGIIDFGMVGQISDTARWNLVRVLLGRRRTGRRTAHHRHGAALRGHGAADASGLQASLGRLVGRYAGRPLAQVPIVPVLTELAGLLRAHRLRLPARDGPPGEDADHGGRARQAAGSRVRADRPAGTLHAQDPPRIAVPEALASRLKKLGWEALQFGTEAPEMARRLLGVLERGGLDVHFRADELDRLLDKAERTGNRIVAGLITAALIGAVGELVSVPAGALARLAEGPRHCRPWRGRRPRRLPGRHLQARRRS